MPFQDNMLLLMEQVCTSCRSRLSPGECRCRELYRQAPALQALYRIRGSVPRAYRADVLQDLTAEQACSSYPLLRCTTDGEARFLQDKFCTGSLCLP